MDVKGTWLQRVSLFVWYFNIFSVYTCWEVLLCKVVVIAGLQLPTQTFRSFRKDFTTWQFKNWYICWFMHTHKDRKKIGLVAFVQLNEMNRSDHCDLPTGRRLKFISTVFSLSNVAKCFPHIFLEKQKYIKSTFAYMMASVFLKLFTIYQALFFKAHGLHNDQGLLF